MMQNMLMIKLPYQDAKMIQCESASKVHWSEPVTTDATSDAHVQSSIQMREARCGA
jgi:hypothetical protein